MSGRTSKRTREDNRLEHIFPPRGRNQRDRFMTLMTVNLIGAGRVGRTLLSLLASHADCRVQDVLSTRRASAEDAVRFAGKGRPVDSISDLRPADLWILTVPDSQIAGVAAELAAELAADLAKAALGQDRGPDAPIALHCSGFHPASQMAPLRALGWQLASVHPVLSFADPAASVRQFPGTYCGLEGDEPALIRIRPLFEALGARTFPVRSEAKSLYHAAAVFSNNFTVVLQSIAREAWAEAGVPDSVARDLNMRLLQATVENMADRDPAAALTGPAARGDVGVVARQGADVARWHEAAGRVYRDLSEMARLLTTSGRTRGNSVQRSRGGGTQEDGGLQD